MQADGMSSWETGISEWDYYKFTEYQPYSPPFAFKITSTTGEVITSYNVITSLNEGDSGTMTQAFSAAYTEESDNDTSEFPTAGIIAIVLLLIIIIGVAGYCFVKRRKQNVEV